jgi:hypothetical protein
MYLSILCEKQVCRSRRLGREGGISLIASANSPQRNKTRAVATFVVRGKPDVTQLVLGPRLLTPSGHSTGFGRGPLLALVDAHTADLKVRFGARRGSRPDECLASGGNPLEHVRRCGMSAKFFARLGGDVDSQHHSSSFALR